MLITDCHIHIQPVDAWKPTALEAMKRKRTDWEQVLEFNTFIADYCKEDAKRLIPCGSIHPRHTKNVMADMEHLIRIGIKLIKIHPPHQLLYPNDYLNGVNELEIIYRAAEANGIPVMFHTGTSIFPGARNKYGDPIYIDDVAVDFPNLKLLLAHGGRPLWMDSAFFLLRRHKNVYLDISGIPPKVLPVVLNTGLFAVGARE